MEKEYLYVILASILFGFIVFGGNVLANLGLSLYQISFIPQLLVAIFLLPFIIFNKNFRILKSRKFLWLLYGFSSAIAIVLEFVGIILGVPVAIVLLLLYTRPLWTILITYFFLKEKIRKIDIIASILVIIGVIILINPFNISEIKSPLGIILSAFGGIALSTWGVIGSFVSKKESPPITTRFTNAVLTSLFLLLFYPLFNLIKNPTISHLSFNISPKIWIFLIIFAIFLEIISHLLYFMGTKKVPTVDAGIIMLLEPVVGSILAIIFLNQALTLNIIIGGIIILLANYLTIRKH